MEKISNFLHLHGHHESNHHHGNHNPPEFQSNPILPTKIACEGGVLDLCLLGKDTLGVCSYLKQEITVYDVTGKKLFALTSSRSPQYIDKLIGGMVFTELDENLVFKSTFPPSIPKEDAKDVEMVPKKKEKSETKKKATSGSKSSEKESKAAKKQSKEKVTTKVEKMEVDEVVEQEDGKLIDGAGTNDTEGRKQDLKEETVIKTGEWIPKGIHCTKSGEIIVCLWNGEHREKSHGKVVKYNKLGKVSKEFESHNHKPFFACPMYVAENGFEDICVSDWSRKSVVVVTNSKTPSKKFEYEGHKEQNDDDKRFDPRGVCVDSFHHLIVADYWYHRLHVVDDRGHFLRYILYDNIRGPTGLCVDENNTLYVGELGGKSVNVIKYLK